MFETIKGVIGDIAAGAIKDQRIALSQEQLGALDLKLREALEQNALLTKRVTELERLIAERDLQLQQHKPTAPPGDKCPYCQRNTGKLEEIKPHPEHMFAILGVKHGFYKCDNLECGKSYDKELKK